MFFAMGDLHLSPGAWKGLPGVRGDAYRAWDALVSDAVRDKPAWLLLLGDVFDVRTPPPDACAAFCRGVDRLEAAGVRVAFIQGQHEMVSSPDPAAPDKVLPWCSALHPWCRWMEEDGSGEPWPLLPGCEVGIAGCDHRPAAELRRRLADLPASVRILCLHQQVRGAVPDAPDAWDLDPVWVPSSVTYVLLGDVHRPWDWTGPLGAAWRYSGSLAMQAADEPPEKSYLVLHDGGWIERRPLPSRPFRLVTVADAAALERELAEAAALPEQGLAVVRFDPDVPRVEEAFRNALPGRHLLFRPVRREVQDEIPAPSRGSGLEDDLSELIDREAEPDRHDLGISLLRAENPEKTVREWVDRRLSAR